MLHSSFQCIFVLFPLSYMQALRRRNYRAPIVDNHSPAANIHCTHAKCYSGTSFSVDTEGPQQMRHLNVVDFKLSADIL
ncbi:hypothetical protein EV401DRAFT_1964188 [Pisolithus croceorrhizus]|nr:hypothetical protein EV401DRAFT_1964188 [Pisolithus croceorrhizus]